MGKTGITGYSFIRAATWFIQLFPLRIHYINSDLFYQFIFYIVRYRRKVVSGNLRNSFPEKSNDEIAGIAKRFYHNLCDTFIEVLYFDRISEQEIKKRVTILNPEMPEKYIREGRPVVIALGHYNNWEWTCCWPLYADYTIYGIYKKVKSKSFDKFYYNLRSRFGVIPLERADTYRQLIADRNNHKATVSNFLMDQTPRIHEIQYWTTFLNQETPVLMGTEKMAHKLDAVVLFLHIRKLKRGYNQLEFSVITENARESKPFEITERATRMLEEKINERPELWLWSHRRWKHKRVVSDSD